MPDPPGQPDAPSRSGPASAVRGVTAGAAPTWLPEALAQNTHWLRTVLIARGVEPHAVDDVWQEVAAGARRGAPALRDPQRAAPWLYRIAAVAAMQHRRRSGRRRKLVQRFADSGLAPSEAVDRDPLAWLLAAEAQRLYDKP